MLNPSDVYVSGGSNNLLACWTDKVTKYDASSFYNWEQDNLPLHDLDERTHLLWEKFGHPTSALTGMSFIVSADATDTCNPLFFTTLSACINALPEVINCPILVEVASFGNLGGLNLSNKAFGPNGSLEIINRNSAFAYPRSLDTTQIVYNKLEYDTSYTDYALASAVAIAGEGAVAVSLSNFVGPSPGADHVRAQCLTRLDDGSQVYIASGINSTEWVQDSRFKNPYVFAKRVDAQALNRLSAGLSSTTTPWDNTAVGLSGALRISFDPFDKDNHDPIYDVSTLNFITGNEIAWGNSTDEGVAYNPGYGAMSFSYFNSLEYIKVNECNGPVYIRNFNVDGQHAIDRGIEISNSQVNLERCSVSRCNKAGLYVNNSEVNILRGLVAYRNYEVVDSVRTGTPFATKRLSYSTQSSYGAGIFANNSTINFKSTYDRDIEKSLQASGSITYEAFNALIKIVPLYAVTGSIIPLPSQENLTCFSRNDIGIHAVNSLITGGRTELNGSAITGGNAPWFDATQIFSELNTEAGIKLENSVLDYSGRILLDGNYRGLDSVNSEIKLDTIAARRNQSTGLKLVDSDLIYNKNAYASILQQTATTVENFRESQIACLTNGQDITCDNSTIRPVYTSSMPTIYGMVYASGSFGLEEQTGKILPSVELKGNSDADFIHTRLIKEPAAKTRTSHYGLLARVEDNSTLTMRGSNEYANMIVGPASRADSVNVAGLYANNGSTIKMQGPTSVFRLGIDALAEDNSNIEITPHQNSNGELLVSSFDLSNPLNHTMVELHSTRACLVADRNSNILMENLGHYYDKWLTSPYASAALITPGYKFSDSVYANYVSAGYMQFYPNGNTTLLDADVAAANNKAVTGTGAYQFGSPGAGVMAADFIYNASPSVSSVTTGGMCVRAVGGSNVKAFNVHFPHNAFENTSSVIYDYEGQDPLPGPHCSRLFIWNIADNSFLDAAYLSISGTHPRDAGFYGPSGQWGDLSGAPSSTPDTSSLSILDYYGQSNDNPFGKSASGENFGCFRLYFSTDPATDFLVASGSNRLQGLARQLFAQGYNFSGNMIASATTEFDPSSQFISVLQRDENNNIEPSGFYYASAMMAGSDSIKAYLDDSALNSFANAKHNTVGKSGLAKVVQGYYDIESPGGDSYSLYPYGNGLGSINNFDLKKDD